jgi:hypothetical protein
MEAASSITTTYTTVIVAWTVDGSITSDTSSSISIADTADIDFGTSSQDTEAIEGFVTVSAAITARADAATANASSVNARVSRTVRLASVFVGETRGGVIERSTCVTRETLAYIISIYR